MFRNFQELEVVLNVYNDKIYSIRKASKYNSKSRYHKKIVELKNEEQLIRKKIFRYIEFYKIKISNNYLESLIYGNELKELELYYQEYFKDTNWEKSC